MKVFQLMNSLIKIHIPFVLLSLLLALLTITSNVGLLSASSVLISRAALHPEVLDLMVLIVAVRFFGISRGVFRYLERIISHNTTFKILSSLRKWVFKSFNENYYENNRVFKTGIIYTRLVNNVDTLKDFFLRVLYPFITAVLTGILTAIFISYFSKTVSIVYILLYIFSGFLLPVILFRFNTKLMDKENILRKDINTILLDILNGIFEVHSYSIKDLLSKRYSELCSELSKVQTKKDIITSLGDNIYSFSVTLLMAFTLAESAPLVYDDWLKGIYFAMLPLVIMASFEALLPMANILYKYNESCAAEKSISSIIGSSVAEKAAKAGTISGRSLSIKALCVTEADSENFILKDISFELPQGKKLAVVGMSGSGKSTLLKTLLGFLKYSSGEIILGGLSYSNLDIDAVRSQFTYVEQNPYIFNTTIKENLLIADPMADDGAVSQSLNKAQILNFVKELPEGLNTLLGQFGSRVSGGEKQRLAIARALLKDSSIVLLDEPTSSLDIELEKSVVRSIHDYIQGKSCIWVTHRFVDMDKMDEIIVLDKGQIVERGTHQELVDKMGLYYKLWITQKKRTRRCI